MAHVIHDIIVLDDDDDEEEEKPHCSTAQRSPPQPQPATNGKKGSGDGSKKSTVYTAQNNKLFEEFVNYCSKLTVEHPEVITFLEGRFSKANPSFLSSVEFHNVLGRCLTKVQSKRSKVYVYINELCTALKANSQKRKVTLLTSTASKPVQEDPEKADEKTEVNAEEDNSTGRKTGSKRQIRYLENLLRIYSREIQKLQEKELSLDELEDEDSSYIQEARLKRKILRIFQKLCDLKDCSSLTGRVIEQKIPYKSTRYPEVNRRLEKFINGSHDVFPDYNDVLRVILKANDKHSLGLPRRQMQGMAQDAFRELGNRLQERRHLDLVYNFGCHLTDSYKPGNDPAHQDSSLQRRLRENRNVAVDRLDDLIKKYVDMQDVGEEEERKKRKKNSEAQNSPKTSSRPTPSPSSPESEDEEESEESETDIEDLMNSQEIAGEDGKEEEAEEEEEDEEEHPVDQEQEADQRMENCSDPQPFSSTGEEENEDKNEEMDSETEEGAEEPADPSTSPDSSPQTNREEGKSTSLELEIEFLPFDRSPCSSGEETSPHSSMDKQNGELKVDSMESKSEDINTRDDTESHALKVCDKTAENVEEGAECNLAKNTHVEDHDPADVEMGDPADVEEVDPADVEEVDPADVEEVDPADVEEVDPADVEEVDPADVEEGDPADVEEGDPADVEEGDPADVEEGDPAANVNVADVPHVEDDLQADCESSSSGNVQADEGVSEVTNTLEDAESLEGDQLDSCIQKESPSFRESTTPAIREKVLAQSRQVDADIRSTKSPVRTDKIASCTESKLQTKHSPFEKKTTSTDIEVQCNKSHTKADSPASHDSLFIDSGDENDMHEDPEDSCVGSINGVDRVTREEQDITGPPFRSNPTNKDCIRDSSKSKWTKDPIPPSKKRKRRPSQTLPKNGKRVLNGSGQDGEKMTKQLKKERRERYYASPLPIKSAKTNEGTSDITLAMVVTCSPPSSPSPKGTPPRTAHVSTQCDPDEVIVLSD